MPRRKWQIEHYKTMGADRGIVWQGSELPRDIMESTPWLCLHCGHTWSTCFHNMKNGAGCKACCIERQRYSEDEYIEYANQNGFKYLGGYVGNVAALVTWMCDCGNRWDACFSSIRNGTRCPFCASNKKRTEAEYRKLAKDMGFEYISGYTGNVKDNFLCKCKNGHLFNISYDKMANKGQGCGKCAKNQTKEESAYYRLAAERGIEYVGGYTGGVLRSVEWKCKKGHVWSARYDNIRNGKNCPVCRESQGERDIASWLDGMGIPFEREKRFDSCRAQKTLPFDFYFSINGIEFLCEYDGIQHFEKMDFYTGHSLEGTQERDRIKNEWSLKNGYNLIRIPYTVTDVGSYLSAKIQQLLNDEG